MPDVELKIFIPQLDIADSILLFYLAILCFHVETENNHICNKFSIASQCAHCTSSVYCYHKN